jgi:ubiquinone/menaquinone biosynthesis C-methylase UbiE
MTKKNRVTRGVGLLENYLARQRANIANKLISNGRKKEKILDIGCGSYPYFLINSSFREKHGIDPSVNLNLEKNKSVILKKIDIEKNKLAFKDNTFDAVTMLAVFEHINNDKLQFVLREIYRVLKKGGVFVITTPAPWADWILHFMGKVHLISKEEIEDHKHNHNNVRINSLLESAGFKKDNINSGLFELGMNMWFSAKK